MRTGWVATVVCVFLAALAVGAGPAHAAGPAKAAKPAVRIGVYDSRGVVMAYARSPEFTQSMRKLRADYERAKAEGDSALVKKLGQEGPWMQVRLHQRGFSTAGAGDLLAKVADQLPGVAREAGVVLIVSKWEMPYQDPSVEVVDVTVPLAKLFKADEATLKLLDQLAKQAPVPFDELPLDPND
jgi:hypothetical protein